MTETLDLDAPPNHPPTVYDLIANVTHESTAGTTRDKENTVYKVHLRAGGTDDDWYLIQDLIVEKARREMIFLGETVLQVRPTIFACCSFHPRSCSNRFGNEGTCLRERKWMLIDSWLHVRSNKQRFRMLYDCPHGTKSTYALPSVGPLGSLGEVFDSGSFLVTDGLGRDVSSRPKGRQRWHKHLREVLCSQTAIEHGFEYPDP